MFEVDQVKNLTPDTITLVAFHEVSYRISQGIYGLLKHEYIDSDTELKDGSINRYGIGFELYLGSAAGLIIQVRQSHIETVDIDQPDPELLLQLHGWF